MYFEPVEVSLDENCLSDLIRRSLFRVLAGIRNRILIRIRTVILMSARTGDRTGRRIGTLTGDRTRIRIGTRIMEAGQTATGRDGRSGKPPSGRTAGKKQQEKGKVSEQEKETPCQG